MIVLKKLFGLVLFLFLLNIQITVGMEPISIITDRDIYISGEKVLLHVFVEEKRIEVICVEMITPTGTHIVGAVIPVIKQNASGYLSIPDSLSTGSYFIKASPGPTPQKAFLIKDFHVVNRFQISPDECNFQTAELKKQEFKPLNAKITGRKETYLQREEVSLRIHIGDKQLMNLKDVFFIAVTEKAARCETGAKFIGDLSSIGLNAYESGVIFSGKVLAKHSGIPQPNQMVYLTIVDTIPFFDYCKTDSYGKFHFVINDFYGPQNASTGILYDGLTNLQIVLDKHFSTDLNLDLTYNNLIIKEELKRKLVQFQKMVNTKKAFQIVEHEINSKKRLPDFPYAYYGRSVYTVYPEEYIPLKNFTEISRELLPGVMFRKTKGTCSLNLVNESTNSYFKSAPHVLLNGIPLSDIATISNLGTNEIERIEVLTEERFFGDLKFEGVLALHTTDFAKKTIDHSNNTVNANLEGLQNSLNLSENLPDKKYIPDFRQVLYWDSATIVKDELNIQFRTSDIIGDFELKIYTRNTDRELVCFSQTINVVKE